MPSGETSPVEERTAMFRKYDTGAHSAAGLAARYSTSREMVYVWTRRREAGCDRLAAFSLAACWPRPDGGHHAVDEA